MQPLYDQLALDRHIVPVDRRAVRRPNARRVRRILVQHRQTVQRPNLITARQRIVRRLGAFQRLLRQKGHHRIHRRVDPFDLRNVSLSQFDTGKFAAADARGQFLCIAKAEISRHLRVRLLGGIHL